MKTKGTIQEVSLCKSTFISIKERNNCDRIQVKLGETFLRGKEKTTDTGYPGKPDNISNGKQSQGLTCTQPELRKTR